MKNNESLINNWIYINDKLTDNTIDKFELLELFSEYYGLTILDSDFINYVNGKIERE